MWPPKVTQCAEFESGELHCLGVLQERVYRSRIHDVKELKERLLQWRSHGGAVAVVALPLDWTATKYCCISSSYYITVTFFFLREVLDGLEYAKMHLLPKTPLESSRPSPDSIVGWGGDTLPRLHPTRRRHLHPRASGARVCPLHIISGYATGLLREWKLLDHFVIARQQFAVV